MKIWKIIIISFLVTIAISFIPIEKNLRTSNECSTVNESACFEMLPTYGFPITIAEPNIWISPADAVEIDLSTIIRFIFNWITFFMLLEILNLIYKKIKIKNYA